MFVFEGVGMGGIVSPPTRVELVELMGRVRRGTKEGCEEGLGVLIIVGEYGFEREWGKGDMDDGQHE